MIAACSAISATLEKLLHQRDLFECICFSPASISCSAISILCLNGSPLGLLSTIPMSLVAIDPVMDHL
jgi:hypothetical protein